MNKKFPAMKFHVEKNDTLIDYVVELLTDLGYTKKFNAQTKPIHWLYASSDGGIRWSSDTEAFQDRLGEKFELMDLSDVKKAGVYTTVAGNTHSVYIDDDGLEYEEESL